MLFHYLRNPVSGQYCEQLTLKIKGKIDIDTFTEAWDVVVGQNEMLRTLFRWEKVKQPSQIVLKEYPLQFQYFNLSRKRETGKNNRLEDIILKDRSRMFDLHDVPFRITLVKTNANDYHMIISNHHILYDGWSTGLILSEFFNTYQCLLSGIEPKSENKASFKSFIQYLRSRDRTSEEVFWKQYLSGWDTGNQVSSLPAPFDYTGNEKREPGQPYRTGEINPFASTVRAT